jgi:hypothetical protein
MALSHIHVGAVLPAESKYSVQNTPRQNLIWAGKVIKNVTNTAL